MEGFNPNPIHDFHDKLSFSVQAVNTLQKVGKMNCYIRIILEKLPGVMGDIVGLDDVCQELLFKEFLEALRK